MRVPELSVVTASLRSAWEGLEPWIRAAVDHVDRHHFMPAVIVLIVVMFIVAMVHGACADRPDGRVTVLRGVSVVLRLGLAVAAAALLVVWALFAMQVGL